MLLGVLLDRSRYVPRVPAALVVAAGTGYAFNNPVGFFVDLAPVVTAVLLAPVIVGEIGLMLWLLGKVSGSPPRRYRGPVREGG